MNGELLEENHFINDDVIKSILITAQRSIKKKQEREKKKRAYTGAKWSEQEDKQLVEEYKNNGSIKEIAESHKRTEGAIRSRLIRLGILNY